jgi:hypothetical protein
MVKHFMSTALWTTMSHTIIVLETAGLNFCGEPTSVKMPSVPGKEHYDIFKTNPHI